MRSRRHRNVETEGAGVAAGEAAVAGVVATDEAVEEVTVMVAVVAAPACRHEAAGAGARLGTPSSATRREDVN